MQRERVLELLENGLVDTLAELFNGSRALGNNHWCLVVRRPGVIMIDEAR
jgi:hypothetical protein